MILDSASYLELCPEVRRATPESSIKSQVLDLKTLPIFSPLKISVMCHYSVCVIYDLSKAYRSLITEHQPANYNLCFLSV